MLWLELVWLSSPLPPAQVVGKGGYNGSTDALTHCGVFAGAPGPPGVPIIVRYSSAIAIHWSSGDPGKGPITRYVIEARPSGMPAQARLFSLCGPLPAFLLPLTFGLVSVLHLSKHVR